MFDWLKKIVLPSSSAGNEDSSAIEGDKIESEPNARSPVLPTSKLQPESFPRGPHEPRTLAAELQNKHLQRPLLFEPALRQYSAYRAGEPVFTDEGDGTRWFQLRSRVLQHILIQICQSTVSQHLILRGSLLMSLWFGHNARRPGDMDWVVIPDSWSYKSQATVDLISRIEKCLKGTVHEGDVEFTIPNKEFASDDIWMYEKAPGKRLIIPWECEDAAMNGTVQMDLVFGETMPSEPVLVNISATGAPTVQVASASAAQSLAWKILWLETDAYGQGKDLYDAVLLAEHAALDSRVLRETFLVGATLNNCYPDPLSKFDANSIRKWFIEWDDFKKEYPSILGTEQEWKERLITALGPLFSQLENQS